jgi:hypothetical protein
VPVSSEVPIGGDQEEPVFEEDFTQLVEEGKWLSPSALSFLPMSLHVKLLTVKIRQPSHEFTFGVGMNFVSYSLVLTPVV